MPSLTANPSFMHQVYMLLVLSSDLKKNNHNHLCDAFPERQGMLTPSIGHGDI